MQLAQIVIRMSHSNGVLQRKKSERERESGGKENGTGVKEKIAFFFEQLGKSFQIRIFEKVFKFKK